MLEFSFSWGSDSLFLKLLAGGPIPRPFSPEKRLCQRAGGAVTGLWPSGSSTRH